MKFVRRLNIKIKLLESRLEKEVEFLLLNIKFTVLSQQKAKSVPPI